jgi:peptidyl-prolyl cis-trans isomerase D
LNSAPDVSNAIFSAPKGDVTQVFPVENSGKAAYAVITNVSPSRVGTFDEVQKEAVDRYTNELANTMMEEAATQAAERAKKGEDFKLVAKSEGSEVKTAPAFTIMGAAEGIGPASTLSEAFAPRTKIGDVLGPITNGGSIYVAKITDKQPADMSKFVQNRDAMVQTLKQKKSEVQGALFGDSVVAELKRRGIVKVNEQAIQRYSASFRS